jgi:hypothetical protein
MLKGQCHEIFNPRFIHQTTPPRALIHGLKPICIWLRYRRENRDNRLQSSDPAVLMRPRNQIPRFQWDHGNQSRGLNETAETDDKNFQFYLRIFGCLLPEPQNFSCRIPQSQWDRGIGFRGLNETPESVPAVSMRPRNRILRSQRDCRNFMTPWESLQKRILVLIPFKGKPS